MNYRNLFKTSLFACMAGMLIACSNDDHEGDEALNITANYSNKLADGARANLGLTYSGDSLIGKNVIFQTTDAKTGTLTLVNILPHEKETEISNVAITSDGNGGYTFSGSSTSPLNTTFTYSGKVRKGHLDLDLTDVKIPENTLTKYGTWEVRRASWTSASGGMEGLILKENLGPFTPQDLGPTAGAILGNLIGSVLKDVTFSQDGKITATYASLPELKTSDYVTLMFSNLTRDDSEWTSSPNKLLATAYMTDDHTLYVTPNIDMIYSQIQKDKTRSSRAIDITGIGKAYETIATWGTTGIKLVVNKDETSTDNGVTIAITADEIKPLLALLDLLPDSVRNKEIDAPMIGKITLGEILEKFEIGDNFQFYLYLDPQTTTNNN